MSDDDVPLVRRSVALANSPDAVSQPVPSCSDSSPLLQKGSRLASKQGRKPSKFLAAFVAAVAPAIVSDGSPLHKKGRARKFNRDRFLKNPLLALQCKEGKEGHTASEQSNSSDDADESDLSYVSQGCDHSNAEKHVYMEGMGTQGSDSKFGTPLHNQGASGRGLVSVAGAFCEFDISLTLKYHSNLHIAMIEERIRMRRAAKKMARFVKERSKAVPVTAPVSPNNGRVLANTKVNHHCVQSHSPSRLSFSNKYPTFSNHEGFPSNESTFRAAIMNTTTTMTTCSLPVSSLSSPKKQYLYSPEVKSRGPVSPLPQPGRMRCKLLRPPPMVVRPSTSEVGVQTSCLEELPVASAS